MPAWCRDYQFSRKHNKYTPDCDKQHLPEYGYEDIRRGFALDPRKQLGKALSGNFFESKRVIGWTILNTKCECTRC